MTQDDKEALKEFLRGAGVVIGLTGLFFLLIVIFGTISKPPNPSNYLKMTKIPMKAITITYTKTWSVVPESHMFEDWECPPDQEAFESLMVNELFDDIFHEMKGGTPMDYTDIRQFEDVVVNWESEDD